MIDIPDIEIPTPELAVDVAPNLQIPPELITKLIGLIDILEFFFIAIIIYLGISALVKILRLFRKNY